jgi:hypothetical protein
MMRASFGTSGSPFRWRHYATRGPCTDERCGNAADAFGAAFIDGVQDAIPHSGWG